MANTSVTEKSVFISGSISIKNLPDIVIGSIDKIITNNLPIIVGDAKGIDTLVQDYCVKKQYFNVTVYSISTIPRYQASSKFQTKTIWVKDEIKKERERQKEKDKAMTSDCYYSFIVWDGKSKGSCSNIIRALEENKEIKVFISSLSDFLPNIKINRKEVESIYRESNGYNASEIVTILNDQGYLKFKRSQDLYKHLVNEGIIKKEEKVYFPIKYNELFLLESYQGKPRNLKFRETFLDWFNKTYLKSISGEQMPLF